ncbi:MAG: response regulator transcription factor, partial [Delftia sp.]|nr:response regulator transcription factor [Delftia sp.]
MLTLTDLRVLVIADDSLARAGLATLLADQVGCIVSGQVSGDTDFETAIDVYRPDVVVWDLGWDPSRALDGLAELHAADPPVVALLPDET